MERKNEKGLFAVLDAELKRAQVRFRVSCAARGVRPVVGSGISAGSVISAGSGVSGWAEAQWRAGPCWWLWPNVALKLVTNTQDVFDKYAAGRSSLDPAALLKLLVALLPDLTQGDLMYFQVRGGCCCVHAQRRVRLQVCADAAVRAQRSGVRHACVCLC